MSAPVREPRACEGCGIVRRVVIHPAWGNHQPFWSRLCKACDLEATAQYHEFQARKFRARVAEIRAKRAAKEKR